MKIVKRKNNKRKVRSHFIFGFFIILCGFCLLSFSSIQKEIVHQVEEDKIENFFQNEDSLIQNNNNISNNMNRQNEPFIAVLEIPTLHLSKGIYSFSSSRNSVSYGIEILNDSDMPNVYGGIFALASHSGSSAISYFSKLQQINLYDQIFVYYDGLKYTYEVIQIYNEVKDGSIMVSSDYQDSSYIVLTTCNTEDSNLQFNVLGKLVQTSEY